MRRQHSAASSESNCLHKQRMSWIGDWHPIWSGYEWSWMSFPSCWEGDNILHDPAWHLKKKKQSGVVGLSTFPFFPPPEWGFQRALPVLLTLSCPETSKSWLLSVWMRWLDFYGLFFIWWLCFPAHFLFLLCTMREVFVLVLELESNQLWLLYFESERRHYTTFSECWGHASFPWPWTCEVCV